ncbi:hypothetical protein R69746_07822 [Paraburkholderia aspalathi]|nr:hypothetical protein R69746_07822 [Paraburkholderia aspalathi]
MFALIDVTASVTPFFAIQFSLRSFDQDLENVSLAYR